MAQTLSRTNVPRGTRTPNENSLLSQINWASIKKTAQAVGTLACLVTALWVSIQSNMYVAEVATASIIVSLITFVRLLGGNK